MEEVAPDSIAGLNHVDEYLAVAKESSASDIHLSVNSKPIWRRFGKQSGAGNPNNERDNLYIFAIKIRLLNPTKA